MSYKETKIKEWEKQHILQWVQSIGLSDIWTEQMVQIITELDCTGPDLLSLKNGTELGESFGLTNPMLSNRIFRQLKNIKKAQSNNNEDNVNPIIEFRINIFSQGQTLLLNTLATENTLISEVKQWYKQQYGIVTEIEEIIFKSNTDILSDNKTLAFYGINNEQHLITVNFHRTTGTGGNQETLNNNWSEYCRMLTSIGFVNIPPSLNDADEIWIQMVTCVHNKTNNMPDKIKTREQLIDILKQNGFYTNQSNWFEINCPQMMENDIYTQEYNTHQPGVNENNAANIDDGSTYENGLFGDVFIRRIYTASSICLVSMLSFGVWFSTPFSDQFDAGYALSGFGAVMLCCGSVGSLILACIKKTGRPIVKEKIITWIISSMYGIGGVFYFFGGCGITNAWNKLDSSSIGGVYFAEQTFVGMHGVLAGYDLYKENMLNNKKWRVIIYNAIFLFLALIAFFSFAELSSKFGDVGIDNGVIKWLSTFYFLVMIPSTCFLMSYLTEYIQWLFTKPIAVYICSGSFMFCVVGILIGDFILTADFKGLFLGDKIGIFMLLMAIIITCDMLLDRFLIQSNNVAGDYQGVPNETR